MMSVNGRRVASATTTTSPTSNNHHDRPVNLNMVIGGHRHSSSIKKPQQQPTISEDTTLSQLEQQVRSIESSTMAAQRLRQDLIQKQKQQQEDSTYLRYKEHEDLIDSVNHEPETYIKPEIRGGGIERGQVGRNSIGPAELRQRSTHQHRWGVGGAHHHPQAHHSIIGGVTNHAATGVSSTSSSASSTASSRLTRTASDARSRHHPAAAALLLEPRIPRAKVI
ncbi:hypothetical protein TKK_0018860 [Trichogramma kaykai]